MPQQDHGIKAGLEESILGEHLVRVSICVPVDTRALLVWPLPVLTGAKNQGIDFSPSVPTTAQHSYPDVQRHTLPARIWLIPAKFMTVINNNSNVEHDPTPLGSE